MTSPAERAARLDAEDPLAPLRERFVLPDGVVYLDGNSLGPLGQGVPERVDDVVRRQWGEHLIRAWNDDDWWTAPLRIGDRIGRLVGAAAGQVTVGEPTSVQLFQALTGAARLRPDRRLLLSDAAHFPTNRYLAGSVARLLGLTVREVPAAGLPAALAESGPEVAAISYGAVDFRTGDRLDVAGLTAAAHAAGALAVWDLSHAAGALALELDADEVDLAVGCTYKYLNGGPGSPAFIYVAHRHQAGLDLPLTGWHGHATPFGMTAQFEPAAGIAQARIGTVPIVSLLALDRALDVFDDVGLAAVRRKNQQLGDFFIDLVDDLAAGTGLEVASPRDRERRGSQVTLSHPDALPVMAALIHRGVIGDLRPPNLLRFGLGAPYTRYADVVTAVETLTGVLRSGEHRRPEYAVRRTVT
jgi:kynureninase